MPVINQVIRPARFSDLISLSQLDAVTDRVQDPTDRLKLDPALLSQVYDLVDKVRSAVREGLADDGVLLERLREFMHKYCQTFSSSEGESYMETATNYEKQKRELERAISINLRNVPLMVDMFEKEALKIQQFDFVMKEAGEKAGCAQAAILLVFPAACHHVRNACKVGVYVCCVCGVCVCIVCVCACVCVCVCVCSFRFIQSHSLPQP